MIDLMAALEASVKAAKDARKRHPAGSPDGVVTAIDAPGQAQARKSA